MKKILKLITTFPFTVYVILFCGSLLAFILVDPNTDNGVGVFWNFLIIFFFPMIIFMKNGGLLKLIISLLLLDLIILYLRINLIPKLRRKLFKKTGFK